MLFKIATDDLLPPLSWCCYQLWVSRTPMQWDRTDHAGFTAPGATPWLPVNGSLSSEPRQLASRVQITTWPASTWRTSGWRPTPTSACTGS